MKQLTWRGPDEVVDAVHRAARQRGRSANELVTLVLRAATDPELAGEEVVRLQERLRAAGLLDESGPPTDEPDEPDEPDPDAIAAARRRAGRGQPLSAVVGDGRGE